MLSLERARTDGAALFGSFYLRRFFRLYPLSMFCVTAGLRSRHQSAPGRGDPPLDGGRSISPIWRSPSICTYTDEMVGGLWTLPLEVQMYVALPFLYLASRAAPVWRLGPHLARLHSPRDPAAGDEWPAVRLAYAPCFVAGVLAWRLSKSLRRRIPGWLWPVAFAATWTVFLVAPREAALYFRWAFCLTLGLAIPWFEEMRVRPLVRSTHLIAKYSYGIYLSHVAVMLVSFHLPDTAAGAVGLVCAPRDRLSGGDVSPDRASDDPAGTESRQLFRRLADHLAERALASASRPPRRLIA